LDFRDTLTLLKSQYRAEKKGHLRRGKGVHGKCCVGLGSATERFHKLKAAQPIKSGGEYQKRVPRGVIPLFAKGRELKEETEKNGGVRGTGQSASLLKSQKKPKKNPNRLLRDMLPYNMTIKGA